MRIWPILSILCWVTVSLDTVAATFTVINSIDSGAGSLRQAVFDANASPGPDIIQFSISPPGPQTIVLVAEGLAITDPVTIDGATQPGFAGKPIITLVGDEDANPGIRITTSNCFIRALVISNFIGHGIVLETTAQNNVIGGTNSGAGNIIVSNAAAGVAVLGGTNNAIRGNSIFGNGALGIDLGDDGVTLNDTTDPDTGPNQLQNFPILTSATISSNSLVLSGSLNSRANTIFQVDVFASQACDESGNGEGQAYLGARSVTNSAVGTVSFSLTLPVTVPGRTITATATDPAGNTSEFSPCLRATSTIPPITFFVTNTNDSGAGSLRQAILDANTHPASGPSAVRFNIPGAGVHTVAPVAPLPAIYESVVVDGYTQTAASPNTLSNGFDGILLIRLHGTNAGVGAPGLVLHADNSTVRGLVIVGFQGSGIQLSGVRSNGVQGNLIGLDLDGSAPGNGISADDISLYPGLLVINSAGNTIGGSTPAARNIISANGTDGIQVSGAASAGNQVLGNYIGTDANGTVGLGNGSWGVNLDGAPGSVVGGTAPGAGNLISWNGNGVLISGGASNRVQGNFIGSDVTGTNALGNGSGVVLIDSSYNQIGGTNAAARNVIVANGQGGVALFGSITVSNIIQGNFIGTDVAGRNLLGNGSFGVRFESGEGNLVGGTDPGSGNTIAFNGGNGVEVAGGRRNAILRNAIFDNNGLGLDLGADGVTSNDAGDGDSGANDFQNAPVITSALIFTNRTILQGRLDSRPSGTYRIQIFSSPKCDDSGFGEGQIYLTNLIVTTDLGGSASFVVTNSAPLLAGYYITATATDSTNNTSEFSACAKLVPLDSVDLKVAMRDSADPASSSANFTYTIVVTNFGPFTATNVVLTDLLPPTLDFVSATASQGGCSNGAGVVTCRLNTLTNGAFSTIELTVHPIRGGTVTNFVSATANQFDHVPENNAASESTVVGIADVAVTLASAPDPAQAGALLTYTVTVTNVGPDAATDISVTAPLPVGLTFISAATSPGSCVWDGSAVTCGLGDLNAHAVWSVVILVRPAVIGPANSFASVSTWTSDPNSANDVASTTVEVIPLVLPTLSFRSLGGGLTLEWPPQTAPDFVLEIATNLTLPVHWRVISNAASPFVISNSPADPTRFYRMRMP